jgi:hypothetical protein
MHDIMMSQLTRQAPDVWAVASTLHKVNPLFSPSKMQQLVLDAGSPTLVCHSDMSGQCLRKQRRRDAK